MGFKPKTCVRYNEPWQAHALTFSCYHRQMPGQWQYSSAAFYEGQNDVPLSMDDSLPPRESLGSA